MLLEFKEEITNNEALSDWDEATSCRLGWTGISCNSNGRVTEMYVEVLTDISVRKVMVLF